MREVTKQLLGTLSPKVLRTILYRSLLTFRGLDKLDPQDLRELMEQAGLLYPIVNGNTYRPWGDLCYFTPEICLHCGMWGETTLGTRYPFQISCQHCKHEASWEPGYKPVRNRFTDWKEEHQAECLKYVIDNIHQLRGK
jgi:hypothetical protein